MVDQNGPVMYFDGECGLCARSVQWCLKHDRNGTLRFAPIQGSTYASLSVEDKPTDVSTMVLSESGTLFLRSTAVLKMMSQMGGIWAPLASVVRLIPTPIRDAAYSFIAKRRIKWFGPAEYCNLPNEKTRARFLE